MSFSQLPIEMKRKIFSNLERKERQALRHVDSSWKAIIDDMTKWKDKCSMNEIKPWKNQLIKLQYPALKSVNYKHLKEKELKKIFLLYKKWHKIIDAGRIYLDDFKNFPAELPRGIDFENTTCTFDLLAGHIAVGVSGIGLNWLYKIDAENIHLSHAFYSNDYRDRNLGFENFNSLGLNEVKLWITGTGKVIYVAYFHDQILFWDVEKKIKIPTPPIFFEDIRRSLNLRRGTDEYFYVIYNTQQSIEVIRLNYVEDVMVINKLMNSENTTLLTTVVKIPRSQDLPIRINAFDRTHTARFSYEDSSNVKYITIPCMNVVIATHDMPYLRARSFVVQISRFDERNRHITTLKRYEIPRSIVPDDFGIHFITLCFNSLFIATKNGELIILKLKNLQHLKYLNFDHLEKK